MQFYNISYSLRSMSVATYFPSIIKTSADAINHQDMLFAVEKYLLLLKRGDKIDHSKLIGFEFPAASAYSLANPPPFHEHLRFTLVLKKQNSNDKDFIVESNSALVPRDEVSITNLLKFSVFAEKMINLNHTIKTNSNNIKFNFSFGTKRKQNNDYSKPEEWCLQFSILTKFSTLNQSEQSLCSLIKSVFHPTIFSTNSYKYLCSIDKKTSHYEFNEYTVSDNTQHLWEISGMNNILRFITERTYLPIHEYFSKNLMITGYLVPKNIRLSCTPVSLPTAADQYDKQIYCARSYLTCNSSIKINLSDEDRISIPVSQIYSVNFSEQVIFRRLSKKTEMNNHLDSEKEEIDDDNEIITIQISKKRKIDQEEEQSKISPVE